MIWLEPSKDIINHRYSIIYFEFIDNDDELVKDVDIFHFDGIRGIFKSKNGYNCIKYKDILKWIPLPDL